MAGAEPGIAPSDPPDKKEILAISNANHYHLIHHVQEPAMTRIRQIASTHSTTLAKTASYYLIHISVAAMVAYAVTGNLMASLTLSLLEPTVQAFAFFFHEKAWERRAARRRETVLADLQPA
jgi:uncharacterized membrane protein